MSSHRSNVKPVARMMVRLHNRRVIGGLMADGSIVWRFKRLYPGRVIETKSIRLTVEALAVMGEIAARLTTNKEEDV
jgi:hypothetical protein